MYKPDKASSARVELRSIDSAANPYLAYSLVLAAGLDGIEKELPLPEEASDDVWQLSARERHALGIKQLPQSLGAAIRCMEESELVAETSANTSTIISYAIRGRNLRSTTGRSASSSLIATCHTSKQVGAGV